MRCVLLYELQGFLVSLLSAGGRRGAGAVEAERTNGPLEMIYGINIRIQRIRKAKR